jgi:RHS repeat-associated protein
VYDMLQPILASAASILTSQFTGKERDAETGLDYFGARYYSGAMGRFTGSDPLLNSGRPSNPQSWNRYTYGLNNPLRFTDPTGLYDWDESAGGAASDFALLMSSMDPKQNRKKAKKALKFRMAFRASLDIADEGAEEAGQTMAVNAVDAYGTEKDGNGVLVGVRSVNATESAAQTLVQNDGTISVLFNPGLDGVGLAMRQAHEGQHVSDGMNWLLAGSPEGGMLDLNHWFREARAWQVSSYMAEGLGLPSYPKGGGRQFEVWNTRWEAADRETFRSRGVSALNDRMGNNILGNDTYSNERRAR